MNYKIYVINLDKDADRLSFMSSQLTELGLSFERFPAILGKEHDFSNEYDASLCVKKNGVPMTTSELGCALSHKKVYEKILQGQEEFGLVFEDDIAIHDKNFKKILANTIQENLKKHSWDYLQFDYQKPGISWIKAWLDQVRRTFNIRTDPLSRYTHILLSICKLPIVILLGLYEGIRNMFVKGPVSFHRDVYFAGCYLITKKGAETLLQLSDKLIYPADRIQNEAKKQLGLKIKYFSPVIAFQQRNKFKTNIGL